MQSTTSKINFSHAVRGVPVGEARRSSTAHHRRAVAAAVPTVASASVSSQGNTATVGAAANRVRLGDSGKRKFLFVNALYHAKQRLGHFIHVGFLLLFCSDLLVSECCLGTMTWGNQNTEAEAHDQLSHAILDSGLNFIDTAGKAINLRFITFFQFCLYGLTWASFTNGLAHALKNKLQHSDG